MVAVGGLSLTQGTLRQGMDLIARSVDQRRRTPEDLQLSHREIDILERIWAEGQADVRRLYLSLPAGWTCRTLQEALDGLVGRGVLRRTGRGPTAVYAASATHAQVLKAMVAARASPESLARIVRLAPSAPSSVPR